MSDSPRPAALSFSEFEPLSSAAWQARIARDLKGADPADLRWETPDGLTLEPFYHREALAALGELPAPQVRQRQRTAPNSWRNLPTVLVPAGNEGRAAIDHAARALQGGADGAHFDLAEPETFDLGYLAATLPLDSAILGFTVCRQPEEFALRLLDAAGNAPLRGFLRYSPGPSTLPDDYAMQTHALLRCLQLTRHLPEFFPLAINAAFFGNRGATPVQQLAYSLSIAVSFLDNLTAHDLDIDATAVAAALHFHVSIGPSYFTEIAKLRALRRLWATVLHAFGVRPEVAATLRIHATTSSWTQTTLDPYTNMLRVTTEAMSAVLGGADSISVTPYDSLYAEPSEFSARIARNVPVILREEAYLDRVADPAAGSYFIETLTDQLAREAWALLQQTEAAGGFLVTRGKVMESIRLKTLDEFRRIATGEQVIVGTNRFQNLHEQFSFDPKRLLRSRSFDSTRAAYPSEVLRLATAMHFIRKELKKKKAAVVLLGTDTIQQIYDSFVRLLPAEQRPAMSELPAKGDLSLLFSSPEEATLMSARPEQFQQFADFVRNRPDDSEEDGEQLQHEAPVLLACDLPTMQDAVKYFGFKEFTVSGYSTDDVLARLQGR
ncbi:methylmalonyl-CoA mutase family protein [Hymenobacter sp. 15J16-1T3B]|uniref:methylmalonyl-CoA mutase family protein n=1 Tax=Hymenobacter sp. 15J16-1T3B TaxID=2886941 RepID=UPI001D12B24C|nr:methylmalonyl-CoA mutase family protein [Hymenobacter sp. 15J16-1T3B]MCC3157266.1 methylmalonyl-CoA mutase family protein [Hymenobacter sp. 15J16-1T3B]